MAYLFCNESFINPTYGERMGLTYRQAKGKLSLKDKIRLKLMKYLGRSRNSLKDKLQDKSLQAAGYAIRYNDKLSKSPAKLTAHSLAALGIGAGATAGYKLLTTRKTNKTRVPNTKETTTIRILDDNEVPPWAKEQTKKG